MFLRKLRISGPLIPDTRHLASFTWRKVLAATLISGISLILILSWRTFMETSYNALENITLADNTTNNKTEGLQYRGISILQQTVPNYCKIKNCQHITCSSIPSSIDPGIVTSSFMENEFKEQCGNYFTSVELSFSDCKFPDNKLRANWLSTSLSIKALTLDTCSLSEIEDNAFNSSTFVDMTTITLTNNYLVSLRKKMFHNLRRLECLSIKQKSGIVSAELNLLDEVSGSLTTLELEEGAINSNVVLRNITGANILPNLQELSIRYNSIRSVNGELFKGVPAVRSLYIVKSNVEMVSADTLKPLRYISQFFLNSNYILSLPQGLLNPVLNLDNFKLWIDENPWHCDCSLKWMQDVCFATPWIVETVPVCKTPEWNMGKSFLSADFCSQSNSSTSSTSHAWTDQTTVHPTTELLPTTEAIVPVNCRTPAYKSFKYRSRKLLSTDSLHLRPRSANFSVKSITEQGILLSLPDFKERTLLWFKDDVNGSLTIKCEKITDRSYLLKDVDPQTAYTICLHDEVDPSTPLNCLAAFTKSNDELRTWLKNTDKTVVITLFILLCFLLFIVGGLIAFLMVRRHPALLSGSERVMLVKRRKVQAIVLPKGVNVGDEKREMDDDRCNGGKPEDGYVTPLPPVPSQNLSWRFRRYSLQSDMNSYVSDVEATGTQLNSWRLMRLKSELERQTLCCPPIPPPTNTIPSLSLSIDNKEHVYQDTN